MEQLYGYCVTIVVSICSWCCSSSSYSYSSWHGRCCRQKVIDCSLLSFKLVVVAFMWKYHWSGRLSVQWSKRARHQNVLTPAGSNRIETKTPNRAISSCLNVCFRFQKPKCLVGGCIPKKRWVMRIHLCISSMLAKHKWASNGASLYCSTTASNWVAVP